jgi:Tol biopolymer transport system component
VLASAGILAGCSAAPNIPIIGKSTPKVLTALAASKSLRGTIYFAQNGRIWRLRGGALAAVSPSGQHYTYPAVTSDGTITAAALVASGQSVIAFGGPDFSGLQPAKPLARNPHDTGSIDLKPAFSPNGNRVAIMSDRAKNLTDEAIWEGPLTGGLHQVSFPPDSSGGDDAPQYLPDGSAIIFVAWRGTHAGLYSAAVPFGRAREAVPAPTDHDILDPAPGPGGQLAYTQRQGEAENIFVGPMDTTGSKALTTFGDCRQPSWSADGRTLLFISPHSGTFDLWMVPAAGGSPQQLTAGADLDANSRPAWIAT